MTIQPLSSFREQQQAKEMAQQAQAGQAWEDADLDLSWYLLRALAQIETLTQIVDPTTLRFQQGNHRYPALVNAELGHLWVGPSFNDFAPELVEACRKHLKTHSLPAQRGHALDYIRNRIKEGDFGALEQRWAERGGATEQQGKGAAEPVAQVLDESTVPPYVTPAYWAWQDARQGGK